jgi:erythromycin esterase
MEHRLSPAPLLRPALMRRSCLLIGACLVSLSQATCRPDSTSPLAPGHPVQGVVTTDDPHAYTLDLEAGDFVRVVGTATSDLLFRLIGPTGDTIQYTSVPWGDAPFAAVLSHVASGDGAYRFEVLRWPDDTAAIRYALRVDEWLSKARYAARLDSLRTDPRVSWLTQHVLPLPSLSLEDDDFGDLQPLRQEIGDARIVLLGEESHASGSTIRAMSRLVRFLHQEMGFDVLAFESSMFGMWQVGELLRAGHDPVDALQQGLIGTWSKSPDFEPLAHYLGEHAGGPHPIEVAGVDSRFEPLDRERLIPGLHEAASSIGLGVEGRDVGVGFWTTLEGYMAFRYIHHDSLPARQAQEDVLSDLRWLAERIADSSATRSRVDAPTLRLWAQVSRSLAESMANMWEAARGAEGDEYDPSSERRDQQMARNLIWLAGGYFRGRRIIVWAHNAHVLRHTFRFSTNLDEPDWSNQMMDCDCGMGQRIWEAFGEGSFVIGATGYSGRYMWRAGPYEWPDLTVVTDQDARFELEELLAATGLDQGVLILRNPAPGGEWLRTPMLSRIPNNYVSMSSIWPDHADAILFLRTITPRRPAAPGG